MRKGQHWSKQDRAPKFQYAEQHHRRGNVCAVGIADRDQRVLVETMFLRRRGDKIREFVRPRDDIFFIENALSQPPKKSRGAILQNFSSRTEQGRVGIDAATDREQVIFVAAGAVQQQQRSIASPGNKSIGEIVHEAAE